MIPPVSETLLRRAVLAPPGPSRGDDDLNAGAIPYRGERRPAAVLCAVVPRAEGLRVILTERPKTMRSHPGQIAFPGGKIDRTDASPLAAALREAEEEVGLPPDRVRVIGPLDHYETRTGYTIVPFVGIVDPDFHPAPCEREVAAVFEAPLDHLMHFGHHQRHHRVFEGVTRHFWAMPWEGWFIWGATAGMLRMLAERVRDARALDANATAAE
jgi:8-oxo-dGTP pyrophosphatase MutT (NUDIX family)